MANSPLAKEKYLAHKDNYTDGRSKKITEICIHHMAGVMTAKQCGAIFQRKGRNGSSNYGIGKNGEIAVYVNESDTAWCNSNWKSNCRSVSIETSNSKTGGDWKVSDKVLNSLIKLVADIAKRNNMGTLVKGKNVTWHNMYTATSCPGKYLLSKMDYIISEANKINKTTTKKTTSTKTSTSSSFLPKRGYFRLGDVSKNVGKIASFMYKTFPAYTKKSALGNLYGINLRNSIKEFQRRTKLNPTGNVDSSTLKKLEKYGFKY